ncbi:MAG: hypothetical protein F4087_12630 [Gemmatimonadetes bacterium]|nr:hypothetical protein [Gemmatimonadota bacterium]MYE70086.1 hypothetical protein [Gemmatimonadota bacterium]MYJ69334.1 hypothetical protein [Gemmatimonadota bacterium]
MVGDLYTMPITSGEATRLTSGMAYDMQPRFSPDSERIVFVSDRSGDNNVWLMPASGGEPTQLSKGVGSYFLSPEWMPDGKYVIVSRSYTSVEKLWLYRADVLRRGRALQDLRDHQLADAARVVRQAVRGELLLRHRERPRRRDAQRLRAGRLPRRAHAAAGARRRGQPGRCRLVPGGRTRLPSPRRIRQEDAGGRRARRRGEPRPTAGTGIPLGAVGDGRGRSVELRHAALRDDPRGRGDRVR